MTALVIQNAAEQASPVCKMSRSFSGRGEVTINYGETWGCTILDVVQHGVSTLSLEGMQDITTTVEI